MKKYTLVSICFLTMVFSGFPVHAQQGGFTGPYGFTGPNQPGSSGSFGFTGPIEVVSVTQVQSLQDKAPAVLKGNIVSFLGGDRYLFRDSSGEIVINVKPDRWWGLSVGPSDLVEISGELKREKKTWQIKHFFVNGIRMASDSQKN